jgi:hypothetical protein
LSDGEEDYLLFRLFQFQKEQEAAKRVRDSGVELVSKAMDVGKGLSEYQPPKPTDINRIS